MSYRVGILGATGLVGQRFVSFLAGHPWFKISFLTASERSVGMRYEEAVRWIIDAPLPEEVREIEVISSDPEVVAEEEPDLVFSALPSGVASTIELELLKRGINIVSNASPMRMEPDIPLINPEVNADHLGLLRVQAKRGWKGTLIKVPNCTTAILSLALKPIIDEFEVEKVIVSTMQSLSGAGYAGVPSITIIDNIIPFIKNEEWKVENETLKVLGALRGEGVEEAEIAISASCHRVATIDGHLMAVFLETERKMEVEAVYEALREFKGNKIRDLHLPTAPEKPIVIRDEPDRPQPRIDRLTGRGMSVVVGRIREDKALGGVKFIVLGHNTIRGAAGTGVLIGELIVKEGII